MPDYLVLGNCLRSELPFPELAESRGREPKWILSLGSLGADDGEEVLSDTQLSAGCRIRLSRGEDHLRFSHSCAGTFVLRGNGREIVFDADRAVNVDAARTDLVARLLLMSADQDRVTWLHGSAVRIGDTAVAFVGNSGSGKSTLALALARNGAHHICDDAVPIEHADPPVVWSSDGTIRLCDDTRMRFASRISSVRRESDGKHVVTQSAVRAEGATQNVSGAHRIAGIEDHCIESHTPLSAVYLLAPFAPAKGTAESATTRRLIAPSAAVAALIQHLKLGALVAPDYPARKMKHLGEIVRAVPVFELRIPRDWSLMGDVVSRLVAWHSSAPAELVADETAGIEQ